MRLWRKFAIGSAAGIVLAGAALLTLDAADKAFPPPLDKADTVSPEVLDADGQLLRAFATAEGRWRLKTTVADVDPQFLRMLVAYEDQRFYDHGGVDAWALGRACLQFVRNGRIVSGASTLSMQVARLIEPRAERSFSAKLLQLARAMQIEQRLSKEEILDLYLTHAPYGGNLEGVRAASLAYFGKEPRRLTIAEAALLVALPQLPERAGRTAISRRRKRRASACLIAPRWPRRSATAKRSGPRRSPSPCGACSCRHWPPMPRKPRFARSLVSSSIRRL